MANRQKEGMAMKRFIVMLGISLLVAGGLLSLHTEAYGATRGRVQGVDRELIRDVQRHLKGLGYNPGSVDGNIGPQTAAALRAYQQAYRLPETGRLDETTLRSILPERYEASRTPLDLSNQEVIQQAQRQLKALGFDPGGTDGTFGPQTEAALRAYQQAYRLPQTGKLDDVTFRSLLPEQAEASRAPLGPPSRDVLRQAQRQLIALGFDPGATDGTFGPQTEAALRGYQQAHRLPQTGRLDEVTLRSLLPEKREGVLR
jgi:peptidoglycan hydrolase-like protein with peptidoglycan-binding domain